jgi:predicted DNA-binding protein
MNTIKRFSIPASSELEKRIVNLRKTDRFCRSSYAEIMRELMFIGLRELEDSQQQPSPPGESA